MKSLKIVKFGDPILREKTKDVTVFNKKLNKIIDSMRITLEEAENGAALAANQVGIRKSIIVIDYEKEYLEIINPIITELYGEQYNFEGCLSLNGFSGKVKRAETVKVKYKNRYDEDKEIVRKGPMAVCLQHEIDHLNGTLYIDRMEDEFVINDNDGTKLKIKDLIMLTQRT